MRRDPMNVKYSIMQKIDNRPEDQCRSEERIQKAIYEKNLHPSKPFYKGPLFFDRLNQQCGNRSAKDRSMLNERGTPPDSKGQTE